MVFTVPEEIAAIAYQNKEVVYNILFRATAETLRTIAADPKHLGAEIGFFAVLHTWGSNLLHHPHLHCVVPGGGLSPDGAHWVSCKPGFFLPVRVLSRLFRRLFLEHLQNAFDAGKLQFFTALEKLKDRHQFARYLAPVREIEWVAYAKPPFGLDPVRRSWTTSAAIRTAWRSRTIACRISKLCQVRFQWKDYRDQGRQKAMMLSAEEFIRRFLLHALPDGLQRIRYFGLLGNRYRQEKLARCLHLLGLAPPVEAQVPEDYWTSTANLPGLRCVSVRFVTVAAWSHSTLAFCDRWRYRIPREGHRHIRQNAACTGLVAPTLQRSPVITLHPISSGQADLCSLPASWPSPELRQLLSEPPPLRSATKFFPYIRDSANDSMPIGRAS